MANCSYCGIDDVANSACSFCGRTPEQRDAPPSNLNPAKPRRWTNKVVVVALVVVFGFVLTPAAKYLYVFFQLVSAGNG